MEFLENICCEPRERLPAIPVLPLTSVAGLPASQTLIEENVTYTTKPMVAEQIIEVPQVEYRDHIVEERQTVVMEKVVHVPRNEIKERVVEIPRHITREVFVDVPQVQVVEKFVEVPTPVYQEKIIPVARPVIKQKTTHVPKPVIHEKTVEVPRVYYKPVTVEKIVEVPDYRIEYKYRDVPVPQKVFRIVPVDRIKYVPQIRYVEKVVKKPEIRTHTLPLFENVHERPVAVAAPRRVPVASPATPVLVERQRREVGCCDSLMEGLFGCFTPPTPDGKYTFHGISRRHMRLVSPRNPPINMDVVVMPRNQRLRKSRGLCGSCCASTVVETKANQLVYLPSPTPVAERLVSSVQHSSVERPQSVPSAAASPRSLPTTVSQSPLPPSEPVIETKLGTMTFRQFEKLNNEDLLRNRLRPFDIPTPTTQIDSSNGSNCSPLPCQEDSRVGGSPRELLARQRLGDGATLAPPVTPRPETESADKSEALRRRREKLRLQIEHERIHAERLRLARLAEERRMQLLELQEQQRLVQLQAHQQQTANEAQHQLFMKEQEHLRREAQAVADDVMIQTRYGPMKFQNFEKLNNEDAMTSSQGFIVSTQNTAAYSPSVRTPRVQAGETYSGSTKSVAYAGGPAFPLPLRTAEAVRPPQTVSMYQEAPLVYPHRVPILSRGPVYFQEAQPVYLPSVVPRSPLVSGPVAGVYPVVYESHDEDLLDQRYKMQLQQLTKIAARNAFQAGRNVYEGVRNLVNGGKQG
uniref:ALVEOLIN1, related n=1 Tax=Neospora caninum (strain Liverpool) TaxID=572307 RepID=A0A0F7UER4_NEOCL|nr:TPA: ALVEOLIN1, related [Neospora caninum Liverpool]